MGHNDHDAIFDTMQHHAVQLTRQVKDLAHDDAVHLVLRELLEVRRATEEAVLTEVERRFGITRDAVEAEETWGSAQEREE